jgi:hypothetical protein
MPDKFLILPTRQRRIIMPYPSTNQNLSEIKLFYQIYDEKNSKPHDAILFNSDSYQKFEKDVVDDLVGKGLWDEKLEYQLENKQFYFKIFRDDEDMVPADAIILENVRILPNQGLPSLEKSLENTWSSSLSWLGSFVPERVKQSAYDFGNSVAKWTEDKLTGLSAYSATPKVEELDEKEWQEIVRENFVDEDQLDADAVVGWAELAKPNTEMLGFTKNCSDQPTKDKTDFSSSSFAGSFLNTIWNFAHYAYNNPFKTLTFALAASSVANKFRLPKITFENQSLGLTNEINSAANILTKLVVAKIATSGMHTSPSINTMIAGISFWNPVAATTPDFHVNTHTTDDQISPAVASLSDGTFIIVWGSNLQDGSGYGVYGQRFNASTGTFLGSEFRINTYTINIQNGAFVTSLLQGGFVVAWSSAAQDGSGYGVYGQRFNRTNGMLGAEFQINSYTTNDQSVTSIASLPNGNFVVAWHSQGEDTSLLGTYGQRFDGIIGAPLGTSFQINTYTIDEQDLPSVATFLDNNFVAVWQSRYQDGSSLRGIYGQRFNGTTDSKLGLEFNINTYTINDQAEPSVASLLDGNFVVVWYGEGQEDSYGIFGQRFNKTGGMLGSEFLINTYTANQQSYSRVASLSDGSFVVIWSSLGQDGSSTGVYGQRFNSTTAKTLGTEFRINDYTTGNQFKPSIAGFQDGSFVVAWQQNFHPDDSDYGIYGRILTPPRLDNNTLIIHEGQIKILTANELSAIAPNTNSSTLIFTVSNVINGQFELVNSSGIPIFNFPQQSIIDRQIQFVHNGSAFPPAYKVKVNEVVLDTNFESANIIFNSYPVITKNQLTLQEGQTVLVTSNFLNATDRETPAGSLIFNISTALHGQFELVSNPGISITHFTQQQIINDTIRFVHDGGEIIPAYNVTVSDGFLMSVPSAANITFTTVNDMPVLVGNQLTINEGQSIVLSRANLNATDVDNPVASLIFNIITPSHGQFEIVSNPGVAINNFIQQQIFDGLIRFVHDGSELAPAYNVTVSDGVLTSPPAPAVITFSANVNDAPFLSGTSGVLSFTEKSAAIAIDSGIVLADPDSTITNATITISNNYFVGQDILNFVNQNGISGVFFTGAGRLELTGISSVANYQIALKNVTYFNPSYNPSGLSRTITFFVNDGEFNSNIFSRVINVNPVNDPPVLTTNTLTINQGQTLTITAAQLSASDPDTASGLLQFIPSNMQFGRFERITLPGVSIVTPQYFTQQEITNGQIRFVTGGTANAPAYQITVSDGIALTSPATATINFNGPAAPVITQKQLSISQRQTLLITTTQLDASDSDTLAASLTFTITNLRNGRFSFVSNRDVSIASFTLQNILDGKVQFTQTGEEAAPAFDVSISDGIQATSSLPALITYTNVNDAPIIYKAIPSRLEEKVGQKFIFQIAADTFSDVDPGDQAALTYSSRLEDGKILPPWINFESSQRQFSGTPIHSGTHRISVFAKDPSDALAVANFTLSIVDTRGPGIDEIIKKLVEVATPIASVLGGLGAFALAYYRLVVLHQRKQALAIRVAEHLNLTPLYKIALGSGADFS